MALIKKVISQYVYVVGPDFVNHRGGIGALLEVYNDSIADLQFLPSYRPYNSNFLKVIFFLKQIFVFITKLYADKNIKIVHIHGGSGGSFLRKYVFFILSKVFRKKVIYHIHAPTFISYYQSTNKLNKYLIKDLFIRCDLVILLSKMWQEEFNKAFPDWKFKSKILYNTIKPIILSEKKYKVENTIKFLFLGRMGEKDRKGILLLTEVISEIKKEGHSVLKLLAGGDGDTNSLLKKIKEYDLNDCIDFIGWVSGANKNNILEDTDIYILPSYNEGLPISILEAMNYGLPIISTKVGGIPEAVQDGVNGILIEPGNKVALKNAILYYIENPDEIERMGKESKRLIGKFYPESVFPQLEEIYIELLAKEN